MRFVIVHPEMGVYVGNAMGMGFFTLLDCAGQSVAVTFTDREDAEAHIRSWDSNNDPADFKLYPVVCAQGYATPDELQAAEVPPEMIEPLRKEPEMLAAMQMTEAEMPSRSIH